MTQGKRQKSSASDREGQINFRYDKEKKDRLYEKARQEGVSVSELLTDWCDEYIGEKPKTRVDTETRLAKLEEMMQAALNKLETSEGKLAA